MTSSEITIPEYLTESFITRSLNDGFKRNDVKIKNMSTKLISGDGGNFCSDIYRIKVNYTTGDKKTKNISLIVKDMKKNYNEGLPLGSKEIDMYTLIVPKLEEVLGDGTRLAPKCFMASEEHDEIYVFQDLAELGYDSKDCLLGLDEEHAFAMLRKIAVFHAASMVLAKTHPELIKKVGEPFFAKGIRETAFVADVIFANIETVAEIAAKWDGFEDIVSKLKKLPSTYDEKLIEAQCSSKTRFKVLNHGDLWTNNIFFKTENNTCVDVQLIDLQFPSWSSPGYDLNYFFITSIPLDTILRKRYDLLRTYYKSLKDTLARLKYSDIPSWDDLLNEVRITEFFAVQTVFLSLPLINMDKEESKGNDLDLLKNPEEMSKKRLKMYESKKVLTTTKYFLDKFNESGLLD